ncbi:MAG: UDP-glucose 4-epimerase GalE [Clostridiales bacterium]|nr:UDP-glucose 4-epimerase GalE [Clostridiales bacterium]
MILLTGGLGYIGSHTAVELIEAGYDVIILDNLSNSKIEVLDSLKQITGKKIPFVKGDCQNEALVEEIFTNNKIDAVVHFAGFKAVGESVKKPIEYYDNNINSTLALLRVMKKFGCKNFVFSSSATVYGRAETMPIYEDFPTSATNPYGRTKLFIEEILKDLYVADNTLNIAILRYFNPIGAHKSGLIGEDPNGIPNNLMPYITKVATGKLEKLSVYGNDYPTRDGTGIRDYIHVCDLAKGHVLALKKLESNSGLVTYNLGTGTGYSVLEIVNAFNQVCGNKVKYEFAPRRPGDIDVCYASPEKAQKELGFKATHSLRDMCETSFNFEQKHTKN